MGARRLTPAIPAAELPLYDPGAAADGRSVRLDANESPFPPPPGWHEALQERLASIAVNRYPDDGSRELRAALAEMHGLLPANVHVGSGSNAILRDLFTAFGGPGRRAVVFPPTYGGYERIARMTHTDCQAVSRETGWRIGAGDVRRADLEGAIAVVCTPNNPTGICEDQSVVDQLAAAAGMLVIDAAYGEFSDSPPPGPKREPLVVVVRTLSKAWALAGLRIGYCLAPEWVVTELRRNRLPYSVDALRETAALSTVRFVADLRQRVRRIVAERERMSSRLLQLDHEVVASDANFLLFRPRKVDSGALLRRLGERRIQIRDCGSWPELDGWLRVSIGAADENDAFLEALEGAGRAGGL